MSKMMPQRSITHPSARTCFSAFSSPLDPQALAQALIAPSATWVASPTTGAEELTPSPGLAAPVSGPVNRDRQR
jgi:hypothetical protein